jgi:hypothetical protein
MRNRLTLAAAMMLAMTATGLAQSLEDEQACTPDALNLCQQFIPDRERVKACLIDHFRARRLSPLCHAVFQRGEPPPNPRAKR